MSVYSTNGSSINVVIYIISSYKPHTDGRYSDVVMSIIMCVTSNEVFMMNSLLLLAHLERTFVATIATEGVVYILHHYIFKTRYIKDIYILSPTRCVYRPHWPHHND